MPFKPIGTKAQRVLRMWIDSWGKELSPFAISIMLQLTFARCRVLQDIKASMVKWANFNFVESFLHQLIINNDIENKLEQLDHAIVALNVVIPVLTYLGSILLILTAFYLYLGWRDCEGT